MKRKSTVEEALQQLDDLSRELQVITMPQAPTFDPAVAQEAREGATQAMDQIQRIDKVLAYMKKYGTSISNEQIKRQALDCYAKKLQENRDLWLKEAERKVQLHTKTVYNTKKKGGSTRSRRKYSPARSKRRRSRNR